MSDFKCKYRNSGAGGNDPQECAWPYCDCDPAAVRVLEHFQECGLTLSQDWRPIDTAPKMRNILLWAATHISDSGEVKNWTMNTGWWNTGTGWEWNGRQLRRYDIQPTHWMPLPDPPLPK